MATVEKPIKQAGYISATSDTHAKTHLRNAAGPYIRANLRLGDWEVSPVFAAVGARGRLLSRYTALISFARESTSNKRREPQAFRDYVAAMLRCTPPNLVWIPLVLADAQPRGSEFQRSKMAREYQQTNLWRHRRHGHCSFSRLCCRQVRVCCPWHTCSWGY
jgi:hypothetical protein